MYVSYTFISGHVAVSISGSFMHTTTIQHTYQPTDQTQPSLCYYHQQLWFGKYCWLLKGEHVCVFCKELTTTKNTEHIKTLQPLCLDFHKEVYSMSQHRRHHHHRRHQQHNQYLCFIRIIVISFSSSNSIIILFLLIYC